MADPFRFYTETGLVLHTNFKAESLKSLLYGLKKVSGSSIFYHLHHSLLRRHFAASDYMNDFARWVEVQLGQNSLAEKLSAVDPIDSKSVRDAREHLIACVSEFVSAGEIFFRVSEGNEFHFLQIKSFITPLNIVAEDLYTFYQGLKKATLGTLFFHLIEAPIRLGKTSNDFSEWLETSLHETELADEIGRINPYMYNLWELKKELINKVRSRIQ